MPQHPGPHPGPPDPPGRPTPGVRTLFLGFLQLGLTGFGGVLPMARHMLVAERRWLDEEEFTDLLGLCQFLPGGNVINLAVAVGMRFAGAAGALAALLGLIAAPTAIVIGLGVLYDRYGQQAQVRHLFGGLAAAAAGLLTALACRMVWRVRARPAGVLVVVLFLVAIAGARLSLPPVLLVLAPLSILLTWRFG